MSPLFKTDFSKLSIFLFDFITEETKQGSEIIESIKTSYTHRLSFDNGVMMIMPSEESEFVHQVVRYIHLPALFIQRDNSALEAENSELILKINLTD